MKTRCNRNVVSRNLLGRARSPRRLRKAHPHPLIKTIAKIKQYREAGEEKIPGQQIHPRGNPVDRTERQGKYQTEVAEDGCPITRGTS